MARSPARAEKALATRRRMVRSAYDRFCADGYLGTTMNAVADGAGVAVQTVYYTFNTKAALLAEAIGAAVVGFDEWFEPPSDPTIAELLPVHRWWTDFEAAASSGEALDIFLTHGARTLDRAGPLTVAMHGAAGDPEAEAVVRLAEERRVEAYREVIRALAGKPPGLRSGLTQSRATDLLVLLFSAELYQAMSAGRGWSARRCTTFLRDLLTTQLLGSDRSS